MGIRYYEDVIERDVHSHWRAWHDVQLGQLNAELADAAPQPVPEEQRQARRAARLFAGLRVMTMLVIGLMVLFVYAMWLKVT